MGPPADRTPFAKLQARSPFLLMRARNKSAMRLAGALKRKGGKSMVVDRLSR
jgi:hypothetical protein